MIIIMVHVIVILLIINVKHTILIYLSFYLRIDFFQHIIEVTPAAI